jgi:uridine kinase
VLAELAEVILAVDRPHPVRVAIDGCSAAGKTTMADELAQVLADRTERQIIRVGIDYFKRAPELRTAYPIESPESYYLDTWDNETLRDRLLVPLGPGGTGAMSPPSGSRPLGMPSSRRSRQPTRMRCCWPTVGSCSAQSSTPTGICASTWT